MIGRERERRGGKIGREGVIGMERERERVGRFVGS